MPTCVCGHDAKQHPGENLVCIHRNELGIFDCDCWRFINVRKLKDEVCDICLHSAKSHVIDIVPGQTRLNQEMELVTPANESINWSCKVCEETHQVRFK